MGTVSFPGLATAKIESTTGSLSIGEAMFPTTDSAPRATASFGGSDAFLSRSKRQEVTTSTAVVGIGISIVGVNFNGPVTLSFADSGVDVNDLHIVDEGGFCGPTKKITTGTTEISAPYSNMRLRISKGKSIPEAVAPVINDDGSRTSENPDGSTTEVDAEGNSTTTFVDGDTTTTQQILADGTKVDTVTESNGTSVTSTVLKDGTKIEAVKASNGNQTSYTVYPDGSTVEAELRTNGRESSLTTLVDGTTIDLLVSSNGNSNKVTVSPEGNVDTEVSKANGSVENSTVNIDGSSYSFQRRRNGVINIDKIDVNGTEISEKYIPWKSFYTVKTTPPGTSETLTPNPYSGSF